MEVFVEKNKERRLMVFVHATPDEALSIIASLAKQLHARSANVGRVEHHPTSGAEYLSIAVDFGVGG